MKKKILNISQQTYCWNRGSEHSSSFQDEDLVQISQHQTPKLVNLQSEFMSHLILIKLYLLQQLKPNLLNFLHSSDRESKCLSNEENIYIKRSFYGHFDTYT